jgi:hypothetical protein
MEDRRRTRRQVRRLIGIFRKWILSEARTGFFGQFFCFDIVHDPFFFKVYFYADRFIFFLFFFFFSSLVVFFLYLMAWVKATVSRSSAVAPCSGIADRPMRVGTVLSGCYVPGVRG